MTDLVVVQAVVYEETYPLEAVEGGWVRLRRQTHGESMQAQNKALVFTAGGESGGEGRTDAGLLRAFNFASCILDHNLGDKAGKKYDFKKDRDVFAIEANVGEEIADLIDKHNRVIGNESDLGNSPGNSTPTTEQP